MQNTNRNPSQQLTRNVEFEFTLVLGSNTSTIIRTWAGWGDPNSVDRFIGTELKGFTRLFTITDLSQATTSFECQQLITMPSQQPPLSSDLVCSELHHGQERLRLETLPYLPSTPTSPSYLDVRPGGAPRTQDKTTLEMSSSLH